MPTAPEPLIGTIILDRYRILEFIAKGAMGAVYRAQRVGLERTVAVKFLNPSFSANPQAAKRFEREAKAMSRLDHPNCVSVTDFGVSPAPFIVMEHVSGQNLREILDSGPVSVERSIHFTRGVLAGLAHAHEQEIVHRDIKPANVMVTQATGTDSLVRILDFGLAKLRNQQSSNLSESWLVLGTPNYMSPEQGQGDDVDSRSDIYSTGVLLFELVTGKKPFTAKEPIQIILKHQTLDVPRLQDIAPDRTFPDGLQDVIDRALAKKPEDRFATAIEFRNAIGLLSSQPLKKHPGTPRLPFAATEQLKIETKDSHAVRTTFLFLLLVAVSAFGIDRYLNQNSTNPVDIPLATKPGKVLPSTTVVDDSNPAVVKGVGSDASQYADASIHADTQAVGVTDAAIAIADAQDLSDSNRANNTAAYADASRHFDSGMTVDQQAEPLEEFTPEELAAEPTNIDPIIIAVPRLTPDVSVHSISDAIRLAKKGQREAAISGLRSLARKNPKNANIPYQLGHLLFQKMWWSAGLQQYQAAIRKTRGFRKKPLLIKNTIRALGSSKTRRKAKSLLLTQIGAPAIRLLRIAAKRDKSPTVRRSAKQLIRKMSRTKTSKRRRR